MNIKSSSKFSLLSAAILLALAGCGGGGGGSSSNAYPGYNPPGGSPGGSNGSGIRVPFYTPQRIGIYDPVKGTSFNIPVDDIYVRDLNANGVDEVVFAGRMTPSTDRSTIAASWQKSNMQIYGWNRGSFQNETTSWFSGTDNQIVGTEPAVRFADFTGDGQIDMLVAPSTDNPVVYGGPAIIYRNTGSSSFVRHDVNIGDVWAHDATTADFNNDNIADIFVTDYSGKPAIILGSADNNFRVIQASNATGASGVSAADFLGNGTTTVVMTDTAATGNQDTKLYSWAENNGELILTEVAALPASRFYLPKWDSVRAETQWEPHEIRNITMDFNRDGKPDVIVFSTMPMGTNAHGYSEVQFLQNNGNGVFVDVTDTVLVNYDTTRTTSYNPTILDLNNDGLSDILLSVRDYTDQNSTSVLIQTADGKFVDSYADVFDAYSKQTKQIEASISGYTVGGTPSIAVVKGPDNKLYLASGVNFSEGGDVKTAVYLAEIGTQGTVTVAATVSALKTAWPWLSPGEVNEALARTSSFSINGMNVIDPYAALSPVGSLSIALNGRNGAVRPLSGYIAGVNLKSEHLTMSAVDDLRRDFQVDLSPMAVKSFNHWTRTAPQSINYSAPSFSHAENLVGSNIMQYDGFRVSQDPSDNSVFTVGSPGVRITENFSLHSQLTALNFSPWVQMDGVWGQVTGTLISELVGSYQKNDFVLNTGLMYAITEINPGLVQRVNNITSVWGEIGYRPEKTGFAAFVGVKPWALSGSIDARIPTGVDQNGTMQYQDISAPIQNSLDGYIRIGYTARLHKQVYGSIGGIMFTNGVHGVMGSIKVDF